MQLLNKRVQLNELYRTQCIYAFLLGAGGAKVGNILKVSLNRASAAVKAFTASIPGLHKLKTSTVPLIAKRGYFLGLDGRRVKVPNEHTTLAGMLQNGESTLMKHALIRWYSQATARGLWFKLVTWPHDEWQTEVKSLSDGEELGKLQRDSIEWAGEQLGLFCPMAGSTDIGRNWCETH